MTMLQASMKQISVTNDAALCFSSSIDLVGELIILINNCSFALA